MVGNSNDGNSSRGEFLPHDIMINVLKRLPVKSLARFNCVSKHWAKLFKTPHFIAQHLHHSARHSSFLLLQRIMQQPHQHQSFHFTSSSCLIGPDLKVHDSQFLDFVSPAGKIVGSCNGLLCLRHADHKLSLCNPATRQITEVPRTLIDVKLCYIGFGFSPAVNDYKIVKVLVAEFDDVEDGQVGAVDDVHVTRVEVYSLTTGSWKEIDATNLQNSSPISNSVTAGGVLFWLATVSSSELEDPDVEFLVSFDIGQEVFTRLKGPQALPSPTQDYRHKLTVYNNKLAIFSHFIMENFESSSIDLWVLDSTHADGESWIKQYSIGPFSWILYPLSIWKDEIVCLEELFDEHSGVEAIITLFNPCSNELKSLPPRTDEYYYVPFNYVESLVQVANIQHEH